MELARIDTLADLLISFWRYKDLYFIWKDFRK